MSMIITLKNNTDYSGGVSFTSISKARKFIRAYYRGEEGSAYWESWSVVGEYPEAIYDILSPKETGGGGWERV